MYNDREVVLSERDVEIIRRIQAGAFAHPEHEVRTCGMQVCTRVWWEVWIGRRGGERVWMGAVGVCVCRCRLVVSLCTCMLVVRAGCRSGWGVHCVI